jgi:hypothetical protein
LTSCLSWEKIESRSNRVDRTGGEHRHRHHPSALQHCPKSFPKLRVAQQSSNPTQRGKEKGLTELTRVGTGGEHRQCHQIPYSADRGNIVCTATLPTKFSKRSNPAQLGRKWRVAQTELTKSISITILLHCNTAQKVFPSCSNRVDRTGKSITILLHCNTPKKFSKRNPTQLGKKMESCSSSVDLTGEEHRHRRHSTAL